MGYARGIWPLKVSKCICKGHGPEPHATMRIESESRWQFESQFWSLSVAARVPLAIVERGVKKGRESGFPCFVFVLPAAGADFFVKSKNAFLEAFRASPGAGSGISRLPASRSI